MPIFIAQTFDGYTEDIVFAVDQAKANVYWQGKGVVAHSIREVGEDALDNHLTGVIPILSTKEVNIDVFGRGDKKIIAVIK